MILKYIQFIKESEEVAKSKRQLKNELWHKNNPDPKGVILTYSDLPKYGIPSSICDMMKDWKIIYKSPYSKSFYSSDDISWTHKPDESYRVSDHWNFTTFRGGDRKHCQTIQPVKNTTHFSIGKYDRKSGKYDILLSDLDTNYVSKLKNAADKMKYLQNPDVIYKKRLFKGKVENGEVFGEITINGEKFSGKVDKYTGPDLRLLDENGNVIFNSKQCMERDVILTDTDGNKIPNPFREYMN